MTISKDSAGEDVHRHPHIQKCIERQGLRIPAPLFGEGFSEEAQKITTLTKWIKFETWPAMWAALLVCGIQPNDINEHVKMPEQWAKGLDGPQIAATNERFREAKRILALWKCKVDAPAMVRPAEFVEWCKTEGINSDWLSALSNDAPLNAASSGTPESNEQGEIRRRGVFVAEVESFWPTIALDLSDSGRNGLHEVAKQNKHGFWKVEPAIKWATERGKITKGKAQTFVASNEESYLSPMLGRLLKLD